jgi:spermidine/putrescine-binding protein
MKTPTIKTGSLAEIAQAIWIHTPSLASDAHSDQTPQELTKWLNALSDAQQALTFVLAQPRAAKRLADLKDAAARLAATHNEVRAASWGRKQALSDLADKEAAHAACIEYRIAAANAESVRDLFHMPGSWVTEECMATVNARYEAAIAAMAALPDRR